MRIFTAEHRKKLSLAKIGHTYNRNRIHTAQSRLNISLGHIGIKRSKESIEKGRQSSLGKICSPETRKKIGDAHRGLKHTEEMKLRMSQLKKGSIPWNKGKKMSQSCRNKISISLINLKGDKSRNWKGGITPILTQIRHSDKYLEWRQKIFLRDNFICQHCGEKGGNLNAHHKKSFSILVREAMKCLPLLTVYDAAMLYTPLWDLINGITLCKRCHKKTKNKTVRVKCQMK